MHRLPSPSGEQCRRCSHAGMLPHGISVKALPREGQSVWTPAPAPTHSAIFPEPAVLPGRSLNRDPLSPFSVPKA